MNFIYIFILIVNILCIILMDYSPDFLFGFVMAGTILGLVFAIGELVIRWDEKNG